MQKSRLKFAIASVLSVGLVLSSIGAASADPKKKVIVVQKHQGGHSNTGRNVGLGVAAVVIGSVIASEAARASSRGEGLSCRQLDRRCDDGQNWACRRYEQRGC